LLWDLKQLFGQEHLLVDRQPQWPSFVASPRAQDSITRTAFCSAQAARILAARIGPMPFTSRRRSGAISMMSKTFLPNACRPPSPRILSGGSKLRLDGSVGPMRTVSVRAHRGIRIDGGHHHR
jgi:hypothetical protein